MTPERQRAYWRRNLLYVVSLLSIWAGFSGAAVLLADPLDRLQVAGIPLGFWLGSQGSVLVFVALVFAYVALMNALDRSFGAYEE